VFEGDICLASGCVEVTLLAVVADDVVLVFVGAGLDTDELEGVSVDEVFEPLDVDDVVSETVVVLDCVVSIPSLRLLPKLQQNINDKNNITNK
jgi:hypothetical protein